MELEYELPVEAGVCIANQAEQAISATRMGLVIGIYVLSAT
jgi:hypothetical protein